MLKMPNGEVECREFLTILTKIIQDLPDVVYSARPGDATDNLPEGVLVFLKTGQGNCALAWMDNADYYIDLLFFHRQLNRLIVIDLKLGDFKAEYKGQMVLSQFGIHVAEYLTGLPPRELLEQKLHKAVETANARLIESREIEQGAKKEP